MLIIDGMNEKQKEKNVKNVKNINIVNDHGKNTQRCIDGMNLYL
jgi:hypothetical protein